MSRRRWFTLAAALTACSSPAPRAAAPLPERTEAEIAKERRLAEIREAAPASPHPFLGAGLEDMLAQRIEAWEPSRGHAELFGLLWSHAMRLMRRGELDRAIDELEEATAMAKADPEISDEILAESWYALALTHFRLAEQQNCIAHHSSESCIFPLRGTGVHVDRAGAERAQEALAAMLALEPAERMGEARWLYNLTFMALGRWPDEVPVEHLLPASHFASEHELPRFVDGAPERGLARFTRAGSVVMDDFDGDGRLDLLTSSFDPATPLALCRNVGAGRFEDVTAARGLGGQLGGLNLVQGDVNGDGRLDVLVLRGGHLGTEGAMPCSLLVQDAAGIFRDRTRAAGVEVEGPTQTAAFADTDLDGDLDLFVGYESLVGGAAAEYRWPSRLYRNRGDGTFEDVSAAAGIENRALCRGAAFGDVDGDGDPDLYLSNQGAPNRLFVNQGDGTFREESEQRGVTEPFDGYATFFCDYDNDGDLDLFAAFHQPFLGDRRVAAWYWDGTIEGDTSRLFENDGTGRFTDVTAERGLRRVAYPHGASFGDVDNDGWQDVYLATAGFEMTALWPNVMLRNDGGARFQDVTEVGGLGHLQKGNGIAFGDVDDDGDLDLFVQVGGYYKDDDFGDVLFQNPGNHNAWLQVDLEGVRSNRFGVGARLRVRVEDACGEPRDVFATAGAAGSFGGSSLRQEIGLGDARRIVELEVAWPGGTAQLFDRVPLDRRVLVREDSPELVVQAPPGG